MGLGPGLGRRFFGLTTILLALCACDKEEQKKALVSSVVGDSAAPTTSIASTPREGGSPSSASTVPPPERPIPKGQTMVTMHMDQAIQMKANLYTAWMKSPHADDAPADEAYANDLVNKLKPILLAADKGPDKPKWNRIGVEGKGRQIDLLMSEGCDDKTPFNIVVQRANVPLTTLLSHGILVIRCNDQKVQCYQLVRDQEDVLCTTGIRHK
jgi:hypothetical protein